jgi:hypothetical protein
MKNLLLLIPLLLIAGCVQEPLHNITISKHNIDYVFTSDIREAIQVPANNPQEIRGLLLQNYRINLVFDGSDAQDNAVIALAFHDITSKLTPYFISENISKEFAIYYYIDDQWYDIQKNQTEKPELNKYNETTILILGPRTGATKTSVELEDRTITVQGTTRENLAKASDKLVLIVMGIEKV